MDIDEHSLTKLKKALHFNDRHKNFHQSKEHLMRILLFRSNLWNYMSRCSNLVLFQNFSLNFLTFKKKFIFLCGYWKLQIFILTTEGLHKKE